jgi:hypothetical protein
MGTNGQLFPLTDYTDGAAIDQVQQLNKNTDNQYLKTNINPM